MKKMKNEKEQEGEAEKVIRDKNTLTLSLVWLYHFNIVLCCAKYYSICTGKCLIHLCVANAPIRQLYNRSTGKFSTRSTRSTPTSQWQVVRQANLFVARSGAANQSMWLCNASHTKHPYPYYYHSTTTTTTATTTITTLYSD